MSENEMGYRGSKSILVMVSSIPRWLSPYAGSELINIVKEQRVDGSYFDRISKLRCILVAGENRFLVLLLFLSE